jgi:hypothetical protein
VPLVQFPRCAPTLLLLEDIKADVGVIVATVNATGVSFNGNVDAAGEQGVPVLIDDGGVLNTSGCFFNGWGDPLVVPGSTGVWNSDGTDKS